MRRDGPRRWTTAARGRRQADAAWATALLRNVLREERRRNGEGWLQVNIALFPQGPGQPPFVPWAEIQAAITAWQGEGRFRRMCFVQKPPGLRLRFEGRRLEAAFEPLLFERLAALTQRNLIRGYRPAMYEPEIFRFGGVAGMDRAHAQFDADSHLALRFATMPPSARESLGAALYSIAVSNDLIARCIEDQAEGWDIWQRLAHAIGGMPVVSEDAALDLDLARAAMLLTPEFAARLTPEGIALIQAAQAANARTATGLRALLDANRLQIGLRQWLTAVIIFHWNRLGLTTAELGPMVVAMDRLLSPHRGHAP